MLFSLHTFKFVHHSNSTMQLNNAICMSWVFFLFFSFLFVSSTLSSTHRCEVQFGLLNSSSHCFHCGKAFCSNCAREKICIPKLKYRLKEPGIFVWGFFILFFFCKIFSSSVFESGGFNLFLQDFSSIFRELKVGVSRVAVSRVAVAVSRVAVAVSRAVTAVLERVCKSGNLHVRKFAYQN
jgi:hypothetical protein